MFRFIVKLVKPNQTKPNHSTFDAQYSIINTSTRVGTFFFFTGINKINSGPFIYEPANVYYSKINMK